MSDSEHQPARLWLEATLADYQLACGNYYEWLRMQYNICGWGTAAIGVLLAAAVTAWSRVSPDGGATVSDSAQGGIPLLELAARLILVLVIPFATSVIILLGAGAVLAHFRAACYIRLKERQIEETVSRLFPDLLGSLPQPVPLKMAASPHGVIKLLTWRPKRHVDSSNMHGRSKRHVDWGNMHGVDLGWSPMGFERWLAGTAIGKESKGDRYRAPFRRLPYYYAWAFALFFMLGLTSATIGYRGAGESYFKWLFGIGVAVILLSSLRAALDIAKLSFVYDEETPSDAGPETPGSS